MKCRFEHDGDCCNSGSTQYMCKCKPDVCNSAVPVTNADWIRSLDDERLAKFICESIAQGIKDFCADAGYPVRILNSDMRSNTRIVQRWLGEEAKA